MAKHTQIRLTEELLPSEERFQSPATPDVPSGDSQTLRNVYAAASPAQTSRSSSCGPVYISDANRRLYVADVDESQIVSEVLVSAGISIDDTHSVGSALQQPLVYCQGKKLQDLKATVREAGLVKGQTLSLHASCADAASKLQAADLARWHHLVQDTLCSGFKAGPPEPAMQNHLKNLHGSLQLALKQLLGSDLPEAPQPNQATDRKANDDVVDKLFCLLESDSILVMTTLLQDAELGVRLTDRYARVTAHWTATEMLNTIDSYLSTALRMDLSSETQSDARDSLVLLLMLEMTTCYIFPEEPTWRQQQAGKQGANQLHQHGHGQEQHDSKRQRQQHECEVQQHQAGEEAGVDPGYRRAQLRKLAEVCGTIRSSWGQGLFPAAQFDASARQHALKQLADCIKTASQLIVLGLRAVTASASGSAPTSSLEPAEAIVELELTEAFSTMSEAYVALQGAGEGKAAQSLLGPFKELLEAVEECAVGCRNLAVACLHLGLVPAREPAPVHAEQGDKGRFLWALTDALPKAWKDHIVALLPGLHALAHAPLLGHYVPDVTYFRMMFDRIMACDAVQASLQVGHLIPGAVLSPLLMNGLDEDGPRLYGDDFARHLNPGLRKQYLRELFPDMAQQALEEGHHRSWSNFVVSRKSLVADSRKLNLNFGRIHIHFKDEPAVGSGVMKEWLTLYTKWLFSPESGIWQYCPNDPNMIHLRPGLGSKSTLKMLKQCGGIIGLALRYGCSLGVHFSPAFVKQLMGRKLEKADMIQIQPEVYASMEAIQAASDGQLEQMCLTFEQPDGHAFCTQKEPLGEPIRRGNVDHYLQCLHAYYFSNHSEAAAVQQGLQGLSWWVMWLQEHENYDGWQMNHILQALLPEDFITVVCGETGPLCVKAWRKATASQGFRYPASHHDVEDFFWEAVEDMQEDQRRQLLQFWTSLSTLPAGGFPALSQHLKICFSHQKLPSSHTCNFQLNVPQCSTAAEMTDLLTMAMHESEGFGFT